LSHAASGRTRALTSIPGNKVLLALLNTIAPSFRFFKYRVGMNFRVASLITGDK